MKMDWEFLAVITCAVVIKQVLSPFHSWFRSISTGFAAMFCAYVFAEPIIHLLGWEDPKLGNAVGGLLGLTGEQVIRYIIDAGNNPEAGVQRVKLLAIRVAEVITIWRKGAPNDKGDQE
ncbi:hypothetical protein [Paracoccus sanguinis]|uniref:Uncharacterized protein n=1 Tax=Paracoccus sanguinis TaxID=1545044 RepID=A0A099GMH4_9RHOB|nr:hypothetical protein [Paracoccus sanguinis]KGJ23747.1 hypothetical protein IX56_00255 [Paracoccus sanguinis]